MWLVALSATPKSLLHEIFAHHKDVASCNDAKPTGACIHKQGYNCQQDDVVIPGAYIAPVTAALSPALTVIEQKSFSLSISLAAFPHFGNYLRGPPAVYSFC